MQSTFRMIREIEVGASDEVECDRRGGEGLKQRCRNWVMKEARSRLNL